MVRLFSTLMGVLRLQACRSVVTPQFLRWDRDSRRGNWVYSDPDWDFVAADSFVWRNSEVFFSFPTINTTAPIHVFVISLLYPKSKVWWEEAKCHKLCQKQLSLIVYQRVPIYFCTFPNWKLPIKTGRCSSMTPTRELNDANRVSSDHRGRS